MAEPLPDAALDQLFRLAHTANTYLDKPVTTDQIHAIWELMKFAPTSANMMPARLVWCVSQSSRDKLAALSSGSNAAKIAQAPVCVIIATDLKFAEQLTWLFPHAPGMKDMFGQHPESATMALRNSSLQGAYLIMAARALGLDLGPMSGFDNAAVDAAFFADTPDVKSNFIATLGYGDPETMRERLPRPDFETFNAIA